MTPASTDLGEHHYCNVRRVNVISRTSPPGGHSTAQRTKERGWGLRHSLLMHNQRLLQTTHGMQERSILADQQGTLHQSSSKS